MSATDSCQDRLFSITDHLDPPLLWISLHRRVTSSGSSGHRTGLPQNVLSSPKNANLVHANGGGKAQTIALLPLGSQNPFPRLMISTGLPSCCHTRRASLLPVRATSVERYVPYLSERTAGMKGRLNGPVGMASRGTDGAINWNATSRRLPTPPPGLFQGQRVHGALYVWQSGSVRSNGSGRSLFLSHLSDEW